MTMVMDMGMRMGVSMRVTMRVGMAVRVSVGMVIPACILSAGVAVVVVVAVRDQAFPADDRHQMGGADGVAFHLACRQFPGLFGFQVFQAVGHGLEGASQINQGGEEHVSGDAADGV